MKDREIEDMLNEVGLGVGGDGGVPLLHGAAVEDAMAIVAEQRLIAGESEPDLPGREPKPRIYLATDAFIAADHQGVEVVVPVRVDAARLRWHRTIDSESGRPLRHEFLIEEPECPLLAVGKPAYDDPENTAGPEVAALLGIDP